MQLPPIQRQWPQPGHDAMPWSKQDLSNFVPAEFVAVSQERLPSVSPTPSDERQPLPEDSAIKAPSSQPPANRRRPRRLFPVSTKKISDFRSPTLRTALPLKARLCGIKPSDLHSGDIAVYVMSGETAPDGFEDVWHECDPQGCCGEFFEAQQRLLSTVNAVIVCLDIHDDAQVKCAVALNKYIGALEEGAPPTVILPTSNAGECSSSGATDAGLKLLTQAFDRNAIVFGEPETWRLALEVRNAIAVQSARTVQARECMVYHNQQTDRCEELKQASHNNVWEYLRCRLKTVVPHIDASIKKSERGDVVDGFRIGELLGKGSYGSVYMLEDAASSKPVNEVLKVLPKNKMTSCKGIKELNNQIQLMQYLSTGLCSHRNISKLLDVYHSGTNILFRMSYGGPLDLYKRLTAREKGTEEQRRPLSATQVTSMLSQCFEALCHLHLRCRVVHRDIKPENIIIFEKDEEITITLADFDLGRAVGSKTGQCTGSTGTFPFMAPEVVLSNQYDAFATDIWSMGVVCLEALCGVDILRKALHLKPISSSPDEDRRLMMRKIVGYFQPRGHVLDFLEKLVLPELQCLREDLAPLVDNVLKVSVRERWTSSKVAEELTTIPLLASHATTGYAVPGATSEQ